MARTKDALKILEKVTGEDATVRQGIANARIHLEVAQMIYDARTKAGLSQRELAELVGSKQSVIARLEDADYDGHSLSLCCNGSGMRWASAWNCVSWVPIDGVPGWRDRYLPPRACSARPERSPTRPRTGAPLQETLRVFIQNLECNVESGGRKLP